MFAIGIDRLPVTIASGQSLSSAIALGAKTLVGILMPAAWDASTVLTFQTTIDDSTFVEVVTGAGSAATVAAAAGQFVQVDAGMWRGVNTLKVRSGPSGSGAVAQTADRVITLIVRSGIT